MYLGDKDCGDGRKERVGLLSGTPERWLDDPASKESLAKRNHDRWVAVAESWLCAPP